jgi:hypothetical protein
MLARRKWKSSKHALLRGDAKTGVQVPAPMADDSLVRHILFLEGPGRATPYLSATEHAEVAEHFSKGGAIWQTFVAKANAVGVRHISNSELLAALKGNGKGKAQWNDPFEVMQARRYAEQWTEHLLDFRKTREPEQLVVKIFEKI